ncbi:MAG: DUF2303 family protein [Hydrogenophaga sp.]|jgi:uncharacterized protein YfdQ (DUF2303 family)|nr:DUF2303 family protein [Hydrogenophaga sp.]
MIDKDAITQLQQGAAIAQAMAATTAAAQDQTKLLSLPSDFKHKDLESFMPTRRRARGKMTTTVAADFAKYVASHCELGCHVFIDQQDMSARAVLNLGTPTEPGHADNVAVLATKMTAAYQALLSVANGQGQKQATVAEFLEDWAGNVQCFHDGGELTLPKAVAAVRKITIEALRKMETAEGQLSASRSAFESVTASSGADPLPTTIYFACEPYAGLSPRTFVLRLSILTGNDKPALCLRIVKHQEHVEEMAADLAKVVDGAMQAHKETGVIPVLIGTYEARQ